MSKKADLESMQGGFGAVGTMRWDMPELAAKELSEPQVKPSSSAPQPASASQEPPADHPTQKNTEEHQSPAPSQVISQKKPVATSPEKAAESVPAGVTDIFELVWPDVPVSIDKGADGPVSTVSDIEASQPLKTETERQIPPPPVESGLGASKQAVESSSVDAAEAAGIVSAAATVEPVAEEPVRPYEKEEPVIWEQEETSLLIEEQPEDDNSEGLSSMMVYGLIGLGAAAVIGSVVWLVSLVGNSSSESKPKPVETKDADAQTKDEPEQPVAKLPPTSEPSEDKTPVEEPDSKTPTDNNRAPLSRDVTLMLEGDAPYEIDKTGIFFRDDDDDPLRGLVIKALPVGGVLEQSEKPIDQDDFFRIDALADIDQLGLTFEFDEGKTEASFGFALVSGQSVVSQLESETYTYTLKLQDTLSGPFTLSDLDNLGGQHIIA